ncbi:MAG: M23 family metallopeptidase, partial [Candidatus Latescibacteria bacterium]|nr:M23 family metallopeptidase [Candidatus Latescibacterota bacterium]
MNPSSFVAFVAGFSHAVVFPTFFFFSPPSAYATRVQDELAAPTLISLTTVGPQDRPAPLFSAVSAFAADYVWPLDADRAMTSSFCEYRSGHFHAGLDLKTWRQIGFPVRAIADGEIWRLRTSPWGYGKAIYLKLPDGKIVIYAHLSKFAPGIASIVKQAQHEQDRYTIDLSPESGTLLMKQGEIIAYSGQSGAGPPHLHFEIRDADNRPYNPLFEKSFSMPDTIPPTITRMAFIPIGTGSTADGAGDPVVYDLSPDSSGRFTTSRRPLLWGSIAPVVAIYDKANAAENPLDTYAVRSFVDGRQVFSVRYDRFSYDETDLIDLDRNFLLNVLGYGVFHNLFIAQGNRLPFYNGLTTGDGLLRCDAGKMPDGSDTSILSAGPHELRVEAADFYGNTSTATITFLVGTPSIGDTVRALSDT